LEIDQNWFSGAVGLEQKKELMVVAVLKTLLRSAGTKST
jgi:hypothetical protein